ncbi:MAG: TonB-dependent receptor [Campylobacteraceae bacterium]|jgi:outer membrane receptor for ferrienterochelin and colicins|nr:TonB-dependent receptor [Campylobacteraceae bacterium]
MKESFHAISALNARMKIERRIICAAVSLACLASFSCAQTNEAVELDEIKVISAAGYEQNIADAPASVYVITKEDLENKSFNDLSEVLKNVPGVSIEGGSIFKDISIRGMSSSYTLYLIDGKPMSGNEAHSPNGMAGGIAINSLPPVSMIERIEIVRGPMSSLYGSEAMGGVINIITKKTPQKWSGSFKGEYIKSINDITEDGYQGSINIAGPIIQDLLSLQTYGSILQQDESNCPNADTPGTDCGDKSSAPTPEYKVRQFGTKLILAINDENSIWANYDYTKQIKKETEGVSYAANASNRVNGLAVKQGVSAGHDLKTESFILNSYIQNNAVKNPTRGNGIDYYVLSANTQGTYFFESNVLTAGFQYKKEKLEDRATNAMPGNPPVTMKRDSYALFVEDEWNIIDDLALTGGLRWNEDENFGTHINPRLYVVYSGLGDFIFKGGVASGYKAPTLRQAADDFGGVSGGGMVGNTVMMMGNPDVKPETSLSYEISAAYNNRDVGIDASITAYHTDFKDKITTIDICSIPSPAPMSCNYGGVMYRTIRTYDNVDKAIIEGLELTLNYNILSNLAIGSAYTYTETEQKSGANAGSPLNNIPRHMLNANVDYAPTSRFSLWGQYNYKSKYPQTNVSAKNKGYYFVDIGAVYRLKEDLKITAGIYNIFDKEITFDTHGKFIEGRRVALGFNADF